MNIDTASPDSSELYRACRSPDHAEQTMGYQRLWRYLYPIVLYMVRNQPDAADLAQDCAQQALVRVHQRLHECQAPNAFRAWARRIASNLTIDELRRRRRLAPMPEEEAPGSGLPSPDAQPAPEASVLASLADAELRSLLAQAPLSDRSRRAVLGRYFDDISDEMLAQAESEIAGNLVLPSHIQVTRAKNLAKLRNWSPLRARLSTG